MHCEDNQILLPILDAPDLHDLNSKGINVYGAENLCIFKKCCKKYKKGKRCKKCPDR